MTQAVRRKHHYIYRITRTDGSGKYYIGMHSTDNLDDGYFGSGSLLSKSIKKHGKDKHIKEILEHLPTREALKLREREIVCQEMLGDKLCMNLKLGGEGGWGHITTTPFSNKKLQKELSVKGNLKFQAMWKDKEYRELKIPDYSARAKIACATESFKAKQSLAQVGQTRSKETKLRMSISQSANKNSQFGTCWVTKDCKSIKIKKEQLDEYISNGFIKGRTMIAFV